MSVLTLLLENMKMSVCDFNKHQIQSKSMQIALVMTATTSTVRDRAAFHNPLY